MNQVDPNREYTPMQLWKMGVFFSFSGSNKTKEAYQLLIRLVHKGKIPARDDGSGSIHPRWKIKGEDFLAYINSREKTNK